MAKKVLIVSSSPRKQGNSDTLCMRFKAGAEESGNVVRYVNLNDMRIGYCKGCYACHETHKCVIQDDMSTLCEVIKNADVIVLATPVYFYSMSGQLKTFIDRLVPVYESLQGKEVYIFATGADTDTKMFDVVVEAIRGLTRDCMEGTKEKGIIICGGVDKVGDIKNTKEYDMAYDMGKKV